MGNTRDRIIQTTCELLEAQGYCATGLNQIVEASGAPKGSLYYYFPDGKEGLIAEAVERTGRSVEERIRSGLDQTGHPAVAIPAFIRTIAHYVAAAGYRAGGPITAVAMEATTTSERINAACQEAYRRWQQSFADALVTGGYGAARADRLAALIVAAIEGGTVLSRTARSTAPLEQVAEEIACLLRAGAP